MSARRTMAPIASILGISVLLGGCFSDENSSEGTAPEPSEYEAAIGAMREWTEFCDKVDPDAIVEHLGVVNLDVEEDVFEGGDSPDGVASGRCGGTFEAAPGNSGAFQVALRAHASDAEALESLEVWRASTIGQSLTPEFEVGTADSDMWLTQSGGTQSDIDGSVLHGFYRITITIDHPVYDESDGCSEDGIACTPGPQETLTWLEEHYLPELIDAVDSELPQD